MSLKDGNVRFTIRPEVMNRIMYAMTGDDSNEGSLSIKRSGNDIRFRLYNRCGQLIAESETFHFDEFMEFRLDGIKMEFNLGM